MDVESYLLRIAYDGSRVPSAASLRSLHRQHLFTVPFENLDVALHTPIQLDPDLLFGKIVRRRRGGFCYELNSLFAELLKALGYRVQLLSARVRHEDGGFGPEFDHMLLKVELEEPWLADVGFGESFLSPIPLRPDGADAVNGHRYWVSVHRDQWELCRHDKDGEVALYRFHDVPRQLSDYAELCTFHQTSPDSHFTRNRVCSRAMPDGRVTLSGMRLILTQNGNREERLLSGEAELRLCLRDHFGIEFDAATDISPLMA
jgi:N-hydroxyarylamine O-acetyltransferase